jgi:ketosteroid isomerase-like protein
METLLKTKTEEILHHHLAAFMEADVDEIMKDFTDTSEVLTPQGALKGIDAIRSFFEETFKIVPKGSTLDMKEQIIRNNIAYIVWSGDSSFVSIPLGTDTFIMENDKIAFQILAAQIIPKQ